MMGFESARAVLLLRAISVPPLLVKVIVLAAAPNALLTVLRRDVPSTVQAARKVEMAVSPLTMPCPITRIFGWVAVVTPAALVRGAVMRPSWSPLFGVWSVI